MDEDTTTHRGKGCCVEVKRAMEELPCGDPRIERRLAEEIEREFCLREEKVPEIGGKRFVHTSEDCKEVVLEGSDGPLRSIAAVHFWGHQLKLGMPIEHDGLFVGTTGLIVEDLEVYGEAAGEEPCHDGVVGGDAMGVSFSLEWVLENQIAISMIGNHHVLVAGTGLDRKPILFRANLANNHSVANLFALVGWDVCVVDEKECVSARNSLTGWGIADTNSLAEAAELVSIGCVPCGFVARVSTQLAMLEICPRCWIQDREGSRAVNVLKRSAEVSKGGRISRRHGQGLAQARIAQGH